MGREERLKREADECNERLEQMRIEQQRLPMERDERVRLAEVELDKRD